jgi:hypothetical protein
VKTLLRLLSAVLLVGAVAWWLAAGANRGWTKTSVPVKTVDEVTGIEGIAYQNRFVPGVEFLGASVLGAGLLAGSSLLFRTKSPTT